MTNKKSKDNSNGVRNPRAGAVSRKRENTQLFMNANDYRLRLQEALYTTEHIFTKIFRKDGPPLGDQFDSLPSNAFPNDLRNSDRDERWHATKRRKVSMHAIINNQAGFEKILPKGRGIGKGPMSIKGAPVKKHGMGKGLMTGKTHGIGKGLMAVRRCTNPDASGVLSVPHCGENTKGKKKRVQLQESISRKLANKEQAKRKTSLRSRRVQCQKVQKQESPPKEKCELALEDMRCLENTETAMLLDDEELELRDLRAGPNSLTCSAHFPENSSHGCSLCKDLLAKFPPNSVAMRLPLSTQPWSSSPELVNKLFKVFHFLCTYAVTISICSFTFDEFAQAFHAKDSLLLGEVHIALLKLLLSDVEKELSIGHFSHASKSFKFLSLLHSLEHHSVVLEFWKKSLNLLTWTEILRQVLVAAGFGSKLGKTRREQICNKEDNLMDKYGLSPGTLKGELFTVLLTHGNSGMKVSELATSSSIVGLNFTDRAPNQNLEDLITSALSSDITLFEKISSYGYRLRIHATEKEFADYICESEDFGSGDDISEVTGGNDTNDFDYEYRDSTTSKIDVDKSDTDFQNEIDESHPEEVWLLGLMEGEYSDLIIDEKLSALAALIDLLHAGSSIRMEDILTLGEELVPSINRYGSGAKIKRSRSMVKHCNSIGLFGSCGQISTGSDLITSEPIDSLVAMSKIDEEEKYTNIAKQMEAEDLVHPMQSIFLGSDRRYNRYWLFLGPCDEFDPGHRRIYFESSEDGHWEMIDTKEALCKLLSALDHRGAREARLVASLEKRKATLSQTMSSIPTDCENMQLAQSAQSESNISRDDGSSPVSDVDNNRLSLSEMQNESPSSTGAAVSESWKKGQWRTVSSSQDFDAGIWKFFYSKLKTVRNGEKAYLDLLRRCDQCHDLYWKDEKHCRICHTTFELGFDIEERYVLHSAVCRANIDINKCRRQKVLPSQLQAIKAAIYAIESAIPEDAFLGSWKRSSQNLWVNRLRRASSLREFLQVLADFVTAVNEDWFYENDVSGFLGNSSDDVISNFSTMPHTYSAVALWLVKLDILVASRVESNHSKNSEIFQGTCLVAK